MHIKRIISGILCPAVVMVSPPVTGLEIHMLMSSAYEENVPYTDGLFTYTVTEGSIYLMGCDPAATEAVIPDTIEGLPVTHVTESTFQKCSELTSVTLPAS